MSVVPMEKIHLVALKSDQDTIIKALEQLEVIDIQTFTQTEAPTPKKETINKGEYNLAELKSAIAFLENMAQKKKSFMDTFISAKEAASEAEIKRTYQEFDASNIIKQIKAVESRLSNLFNLKKELELEQEKLLPWQGLNLKLSDLNRQVRVKTITGTIKTKDQASFLSQLITLSSATANSIVKQEKLNTYLTISYLNSQDKEIGELLAKSSFQEINLPLTDNTPGQEIAKIKNTLTKIALEIAEEKAQAKNLNHHLASLKYVYDYLLSSQAKEELKSNFADTRYTFVIEGWLEKRKLGGVKQKLNEITQQVEIYTIKPNKNEQPPVVITNAKAFSPFELITKTYGSPGYRELDPTLPLSFFFALFFGLCLGDFGYGLSLIFVSIYFLKKYQLPEGGKNLFLLLLLGGAVSCLVGILTGSYFGLSPDNMPASIMPIKNVLASLQIINPITNPLTMLVFSLALGVIQILFGITLQFINKIRTKDYWAAFYDDVLWLFFLGSLVFLIVTSAMGLAIAASAKYLAITGAILLVVTQGRQETGLLKKFISGLLSLYRVSGYMGDTLSYSRLLALGMSSAIIGSVINILAGMVIGVPWVGFILMVILLIIGHVFNLLVSTLGAFVHSMRLQMVEFFSKFFEGGGREFKPYKRVAEYTTLIQ